MAVDRPFEADCSVADENRIQAASQQLAQPAGLAHIAFYGE